MDPHWNGNKLEKAYEYVDTILLGAPELGQFQIPDIINASSILQREKDIAKVVSYTLIAIVLRDHLKLIEHLYKGSYAFHLTEEGRKAKKAGGLKKYEQLKEQNKNASITTNNIGVNNGIANLSGQDSFLEIRDNTIPVIPPKTNTATINQKEPGSIIKKVSNFIGSPIGQIIVLILGGLFVAYLVFKLGWN